MSWIKCSEKYPEMGVDVLLFWEHSRHIENGRFFQDGSIYHVLFDGESMNEQPSHWMNRPDDPEDS